MTTTLEHSPTPAIETQKQTRDGLIAVVEDLPLVRDPNMTTEERCSRCDRKNSVRMSHNLPLRDETFDDGERVRMVVGYDLDPDTTSGWQIRAVFHMDHPMLPKEKAAFPGSITALVQGTLEQTGWTYPNPLGESDEYTVGDRSVVRDVEIEWYSPEGEGEAPEPVNEADDEGIAEPQPDDPYTDWPDEENEWRAEIIRELGEENPAVEPYTADGEPGA